VHAIEQALQCNMPVESLLKSANALNISTTIRHFSKQNHRLARQMYRVAHISESKLPTQNEPCCCGQPQTAKLNVETKYNGAIK